MSGFADIEYASQTDVGVRRSHNQDSHAVLAAGDPEQYRERGHVFLVADGMGAHAVGELASKLAADSIPHIYSKHAADGPVAALRKAFVEANVTIHTRGKQNREFEGMGTTASGLLLRPEGAWIGHVGDSRVYRVRAGTIEQLSFDHSLLWELARRQKKDPDEIQGVPTNVIIRSLGPEPAVQVDVDGPYPVEAGDIFLVCSDGLSGQISDREIGAVLQALPPEEACRFLIHLANLQGGPDNITAIVVRVQSDSEPVEADASAKAARAKKDWDRFLRKGPWPLALLLMGILLAGLAIVLTYNGLPGELPTFLVAALILVGGLIGLMVQNVLDSRARPPAPEPPKARIHRSVDCTISEAIVDRLSQATEVLQERVKDKGWPVDWDACQQHLQLAQRAMKKEDHQAACREQCRAMLLLMDVIGRQRIKEEAFKPLWDKAPA